MSDEAGSAQSLNVLIVLNSLAPGGTETSTLQLIPPLRNHGVECTVVTLKDADPDLYDEVARLAVPVVRLAGSGYRSWVRELRALIRSRRPDVVHTALFEADLTGRLAAWRTGVPVVSSFVNTPYDPARLEDPNVVRWKLDLVRFVDAMTGRFLVDVFHAVSDGVARGNAAALHVPVDRVVVAERGRDVTGLGQCSRERRQRVRAALHVGGDQPLLLNLGRLEHQKAQVDLLDAMVEVVERFPEAVLLIAGKDGSAGNDVRARLDRDPLLSEHVRLLGHRSDVGDLLCAADALLISSRFEGTAGVAIEAMALGTPVVSRRLVGVEGVLEHERNALLTEGPSPEDLAVQVGRLLEQPEMASRLAATGRMEFLERFTLDSAARRMTDLYRSVAGSSGEREILAAG